MGLKTLQQRNKGHGKAKHNAFDDAVAHVLPDIDTALYLAPKGTRVNPDHEHTHDPTANDAHGTEHGRQQRHGNDTSPEAWCQNALHRVHRHHFHDADLFAGLHQANLGSERSAGTPGKQQCRDHRPQFAHQAQCHQQTQRFRRAVTLQGVVTLQAKNETDKQARHRNDGQRVIAKEVNLIANQAKAPEAAEKSGQKPHKKPRTHPQVGQLTAHGQTDVSRFVPAHTHASTPKSSTTDGPG